eukprot:3940156-Amphidinium_carterae.1
MAEWSLSWFLRSLLVLECTLSGLESARSRASCKAKVVSETQQRHSVASVLTPQLCELLTSPSLLLVMDSDRLTCMGTCLLKIPVGSEFSLAFNSTRIWCLHGACTAEHTWHMEAGSDSSKRILKRHLAPHALTRLVAFAHCSYRNCPVPDGFRKSVPMGRTQHRLEEVLEILATLREDNMVACRRTSSLMWLSTECRSGQEASTISCGGLCAFRYSGRDDLTECRGGAL